MIQNSGSSFESGSRFDYGSSPKMSKKNNLFISLQRYCIFFFFKHLLLFLVHNIVVQKEKYLKKGKNAIPLQNEGIFFFGGGMLD